MGGTSDHGRGGDASPLPTQTRDESADSDLGTPAGVTRRSLLKGGTALGAFTATTGSANALSVCEVYPPLCEDEEDEDGSGFSAPSCPLVGRTDAGNLPFDTGGRYGGWGGQAAFGGEAGTNHTPVVMVHGNVRDACDFNGVAEYLHANDDYLGDDLWAITFAERTTTHAEMRSQLEEFVSNVLAYTGASEVDIFAHSLGVTGARYWLETANRYDSVGTFVGAAGPNHGVCTCRGCTPGFGINEVCQFIATDCAGGAGGPLAELNTPDETPGDVDYYTVRGTADFFYNCDRDSPKLAGARENLVLEGAAHDDTRTSTTTKRKLVDWLD